jgi:catechol 2,3-dioxygenase-like lactoylglutathione lyase family enzyme
VTAFLYHMQLNVGAPAALAFYRELFGFLRYRVIADTDSVVAASNGTTDFWLVLVPPDRRRARFHRKNPGLNHLCFGVAGRSDVDRVVTEFLRPRDVAPLYDSPREFPEYRPGYYAVFFEDPDRLKLEVAYVPGVTERRAADRGEG